ncbi:DUF305 domain-containing protein [Actinomadura oligospora]|uniref:DUF305 domain-containing protein n=1 Tax=Actinomadura oligospora TaxID=111804 RepID=UPI00047CEA1F|nr:DUF305 domain-containing protein [Actinomadura oligospora]
MKKQWIVAAGMAVVLGLGATACGGDDKKKDDKASGAAAAKGPHNKQDVMFAQMMIPHHRQAVDMAKTVAAKGADPKVKGLAGRVEKAQAPEIEKMSGWLKGWGESVPAVGDHAMEGVDQDLGGMMSPKQMADYNKATGKALDEQFLTLMVDHHKGAITMAEDEKQNGSSPEAKALAGAIIKAQQAEIAEMGDLLKS